jgi:hypothetical protein
MIFVASMLLGMQEILENEPRGLAVVFQTGGERDVERKKE